MSQPLAWRRMLLEGLVIVGSILLAFLFDASWDERQQRRLESAILLAVAEEADQNSANLSAVIRTNQFDQSISARFLTSTPDDLRSIPQDSVRAWVVAVLRVSTFNPVRGSAALLSQAPILDEEGVRARKQVEVMLQTFDDALEEHEKLFPVTQAGRQQLARHAAEWGIDSSATLALPDILVEHGPEVLARLRADRDVVETVLHKSHLLTHYSSELEDVRRALEALTGELAGGR